MPVTTEQFEEQFNKLQAAFGTVKPAKIFEEWFKEFENEDYFTFVSAMKRSQYGQRFPTWEVFKAELKNSQGVTAREVYVGCGQCNAGRVLFRDLNRNGQVSDQVANCADCSEGKIRDIANVFPDRLHIDSMGTLRTQRALKKDLADGMRVEEMKLKYANVRSPKQITQDVYGKADPEKERKRYGSLKREEEREAKEYYGG